MKLLDKLEHLYFETFEQTELAQEIEPEMAAFSLLYLMRERRDIFGQRRLSRLATIRDELIHRPDYRPRLWLRGLPLDCMVFMFTSDESILDTLIANISHHSFSSRMFVFESLYYVAPDLEFTREDILNRTWENINHLH